MVYDPSWLGGFNRGTLTPLGLGMPAASPQMTGTFAPAGQILGEPQTKPAMPSPIWNGGMPAGLPQMPTGGGSIMGLPFMQPGQSGTPIGQLWPGAQPPGAMTGTNGFPWTGWSSPGSLGNFWQMIQNMYPGGSGGMQPSGFSLGNLNLNGGAYGR